MATPRASRFSPSATLLLFVVLSATFSSWLVRKHYQLPLPISTDHLNGVAVFNEARALDYVRLFAEDEHKEPKYRIVGTRDFDESEDKLLAIVDQLKKDHERSSLRDVHQIEVWHQRDSSSHLFDFMDKLAWKKYHNITNVVVRISDGTPASKANAVLVNAHLDSTLPSPGAADDTAGVAVMLEAMRVLVQTPTPLANSIVLLFNGAEESLQDASHMFITMHEIRDTIRAAINLEACGTTGAEILFQATSEQMIRAYSHVPRPYGAVLATELFATGLIISDTDFRQFEQYGNLTGLDMALIGNSYLYHTRLDLVDEIEPGALQHMGENVIALLRHLTLPQTSLLGMKKSKSVTFFSLMGGTVFFMCHASTATLVDVIIFCLTLVFVLARARRDRKSAYGLALIGVTATFLAGIFSAVCVALFTSRVRGRALTWFRREYLPLILFIPPALLGAILTQVVLARVARKAGILRRGEGLLQHTSICALAVYYATLGLVLQLCGVLSSYLFSAAAISALATLCLNDFVLVRDSSEARPVSLLALLFGQIGPIIFGTEGMLSILDLFVPLSGRLGADAPADLIVSVIVSATGIAALPMLLPLTHRFPERFLLKLCAFLALLTAATSIVYTLPSWPTYDRRHPKRVYSLHMENISNPFPPAELLVASADSELGFTSMISTTLQRLGIHTGPLQLASLTDHIPSWDIIYPIGQLLNSVAIPLPHSPDYVSPWPSTFLVTAANDTLNAVTHRRKLTVVIDHPGLIWTVIAFDADVVSWDLAAQPTRGHERHHIKEVSGFGVDRWTLTVEVQLDDEAYEAAMRVRQRRRGQRPPEAAEDERDRATSGLRVDFSGLDRGGMWPASARTYEGGKPAMDFMRRLDGELPDWVDAMLLSAVSGVVVL